VAELLAALSLEVKASLCLGSDFWHTAAVERLRIPSVMVADGPHGLRKEPDDAEQGTLTDSVPATCFPTASALSCSWDPDLVRSTPRRAHTVGSAGMVYGVTMWIGDRADAIGPSMAPWACMMMWHASRMSYRRSWCSTAVSRSS
jgi:beta-glucosidase